MYVCMYVCMFVQYILEICVSQNLAQLGEEARKKLEMGGREKIEWIGHFTVMDGSEAEGDLVLIQTFLLYYVSQVTLMLTSIFREQFP